MLAIFVAVAVLVSAVPSLVGVTSPVGDAAAADETIVKVGWLNGEIQNWNPLKIEMIEDYVVCYLMYSSLWYYDEDWGGPIGDLALTWYQDVQTNGSMSTYVNITHDAFYRNSADPTNMDFNLKASDVKYTFELIMANPGYTFDWYLSDIWSIDVMSDYQVRINTTYTKATLIDDLSMVPILCEDYWSDLSNPFGSLDGSDMFGSGPFLYDSELANSWWLFTTAPNYHGAADYGEDRDIDFDGIMYTLYTDSNSIAIAMTDNQLDTINLYGDINTYMSTLDAPGIIRQAVPEPGITDVAINAIPEAFDTSTYYGGNPILRDPAVRKAIMMCLDKDYIVNDMLFGLPIMADSVVQPNDWHYTPLNQLDFDPIAARQVLIDAGYDQDGDGDGLLEAGPDSMAVLENWCNEGEELSGIRCEAPDTDPNYFLVAQNWQGDAIAAGIGLEAAQLSEGVMTNIAWYKCDYDIWVWHWGWGPEPIGGALSCWMIEEILTGGDNCQMPMGSWWYDDNNYTDALAERGLDLDHRWSEFDEVMAQAQRTIDVEERKPLIDTLQQMVYDSYSENPPYYDLGLYAYTESRFAGWGDWEAHPGRTTSSDLLWVWYDLEPAVNAPPTFVSELSPTYDTMVDTTFDVTVSVADVDGDDLTVNCSWGDGAIEPPTIVTGTTTEQPVTFSHPYTSEDTGINLEITVTDLIQGHTVTTRALVNVISDDEGPVFASGSPVADPVSPAYVDDEVAWSATASDAETGGETGEVIKFTWDWADGTYDVNTQDPTAEGAQVTDLQTHIWDTAGTYRVTVYAWDGYDDELNLNHNVSVYRDYVIMSNSAPSSVAIADVTWSEDSYAPITGTAIDLDPDTLTFTWLWDDGSFNVTEVDNTDPGTQVTNNVMHLWTDPGTYTVTLYVDDGMDHNISTTADAVIEGEGVNVAPTALGASYAPDPGLVGETITFTVEAADANGDALEFWIDFGDGSEPETADSVGGSTDAQSVTFEHVYESEGPYEVTYSANDTIADEVFSTITVQVVVNGPPVLNLQSTYTASYNQEFTIAPALCEDPDLDEITVWYDFGDETPMVMGGDIASYYEAAHTYTDVGTFMLTAYADDGMGNNVSATTNVSVRESNLKPTVVSIETDPEGPYDIDQVITFTVTVKDFEGDTVTVEVAWGDGETNETDVDTVVNNTEVTVEFTHAYEVGGMEYTVTVNATDGMDHSDSTPSSKTTKVEINPEAGSNLALYVALGVLAVVAVLAALLLMRRKKKGAGKGEDGSMEGMAPPEPPPSS